MRVSIYVDVDPDTAFEVFTDEIDAWYHRGPHTFSDTERGVGIRFEPFVGGRLIEVYDRETGEGRTMARVEVWEPGKRLVFVDGRETEADVTFEANDGGTRVHARAPRARTPRAPRRGAPRPVRLAARVRLVRAVHQRRCTD